MNGAEAESRDALLALVAMARDEIDALLATPGDDPDELREACAGHLDNLLWASNEAGFGNQYFAVDAMQSHLADPALAFDAARGAEFAGWLQDFEAAIESPDDSEKLAALLAPLPAEARDNLAALLLDDAAAADGAEITAVDADWLPLEQGNSTADGGGDEYAGEMDWGAETASRPHPSADDPLAAIDIDTGGMLGMLAAELRDVFADLDRHAGDLCAGADDGQAAQAVDGYREILSRVAAVAAELELRGLTYICGFVDDNLAQIAALPPAERADRLEPLRDWPIPVIEYLAAPGDDARCIAIIDYLERESWPRPIPYRDQRELIEGLTRAVEIGGGYAVEKRELEATDEHVSLHMSEDASPELVDAFFDETPGLAEHFSQLVAAMAEGRDIQKNVEAAQRIAHTLKGSGNLIGVQGLANLAHHLEDIFEFIARNAIVPPAPLAATMQEAADTIEAMIEYLQGLGQPPADACRVLQDVLDWANRIDNGKMRADDYADEAAAPRSAPAPALPGLPGVDDVVERRGGDRAAQAAAEVVRVPLKLLDDIFRIVSETAIATGQIQERLNRLEGNDKLIRKNDSTMQQHRYELENLVSIRAMAARHRGGNGDEGADFDPLEMDEYDEFYGATHAFIESVSDSREILRGFSSEVYELNALFLEHQRLNKELQRMIMTTRMVPVGTIASRLQRTLRQVCRSTGKQAELIIAGQDLLLDGDVLGKLADPLMHMLRNAVDHGIEDAAERAARGKPASGRVLLDFRQEGNSVVVKCADDGAGLDFDRIRRIAIERGLLGESETAPRETLARLILHSGFSTSDTVTQVSGRGVGMDVVHNTIQSLNGSMDIEAVNDGPGTLITLRIPITLLTSHCLLAGVGQGRLYAIPTVSLTQILSPGTGRIGQVGDRMTFQLEQEVFTACTLNSLIGIGGGEGDSIDRCSVLLVQTADGVSAVLVERVVTSYDLVVKNMGAYVKSISGIAGVSMLGNGEVVPVLDLGAMLQARANPDSAARHQVSSAPDGAELPCVLVVDDSLSVRNALSQLLRDSGYRVALARDGLEAINVIEGEHPDIVLTDLEMPRMNGLELVSYVRTSSPRKDMPVVMITSRNMSKHREQAERSGVDRFIGKPFADDEVLDALEALLAAPA